MTEQEEVEQDAGSLMPTVATILAAAAAYGATRRTAENLADSLKVSAQIYGALNAIALRVLHATLRGIRGPARVAAEAAIPEAAERAVADGLQTVVYAAEAVAKGVAGGDAKVKPAGEKFADVIPGESDDPRVVAHRAAGAVRNAARHYLAEEAEASGEFVFKKTWHSKKDTRVRASHAFLGDRSYEHHTISITEPFVTINGARLRFPKDPTAPIYEIARCRCWMTISGGKRK